MNQISIRPEIPSDHTAIRDLIVDVFYEAFETGEQEASLVEELRECPEAAPVVSLVAEENGKIIGHIFFSRVMLADYPDIAACTLAPVGVYREWQRSGIGSRLIQEGLQRCRELGYKVVTVTGHLEYYPRFGFVPIGQTRLHTIFNCDHDMVLELEPGILDKVSGLVDYPEPWRKFVQE